MLISQVITKRITINEIMKIQIFNWQCANSQKVNLMKQVSEKCSMLSGYVKVTECNFVRSINSVSAQTATFQYSMSILWIIIR